MDKQPFYEFAPYSEVDEYADWSRQVKIKGGRVCEFTGCGVTDQKLLESHHIKPKAEFPELDKDIDNGECICLFHHAVRHWANEIIRNKILARLAIILWLRYAKPSHKETGLRPLFDSGM